MKTLFAVKCEERNLVELISFFRSFDFLWNSLTCHKLCLIEKNCFFCHIRSSFLRLKMSRGRGPKSLKVIEFISQLNQYQEFLGWNWRNNMSDIPTFVENTLRLADKDENKVSELFGIPDLKCKKCKKVRIFEQKLLYEIDTSFLQEEKEVTIRMLMDLLVSSMNIPCSKDDLCVNLLDERGILLKLSHPLQFKKNSLFENFYDGMIKITSIVTHNLQAEDELVNSKFIQGKDVFFQNTKEDICKSDEKYLKIKLISFTLTQQKEYTKANVPIKVGKIF